jgi:hypothetical protein
MQTDDGQRGSADHLHEEDPDEPGAHESGDGHDDTDVAEDEPRYGKAASCLLRSADLRSSYVAEDNSDDRSPVRPKTNEAIAKAFMVRITVGAEG